MRESRQVRTSLVCILFGTRFVLSNVYVLFVVDMINPYGPTVLVGIPHVLLIFPSLELRATIMLYANSVASAYVLLIASSWYLNTFGLDSITSTR